MDNAEKRKDNRWSADWEQESASLEEDGWNSVQNRKDSQVDHVALPENRDLKIENVAVKEDLDEWGDF